MQKVLDQKILVVEDEPRMRESIRLLLSLNGYDAQTSINLPNALESLQDSSYALVLLDLQLHGQSGFAVMDNLKERNLDTSVIIITGEHSEEKAITALRKGAIDYLNKPFEPDELLRSVKKALGLRKQQRERELFTNTIVSSRERYRNVVDRQKDYLCVLNTKYEIIFVNKAYADYLGYTPQGLVGHPYKNYIHESSHHLLFGSLDTVRSDSTSIAVELQIVDINGRIRWQEWEYNGILNGHETLSEIQCVGRDVTRNKLLTIELEKKKEKFRKLAEVTSDWLWELDKDNTYTYTNPVVYDLLGYQPEEILGKKPFDFMPKDEAGRIRRVFRKLKAEGKPLKGIENVNLHKNGSRVTLETSGIPIFDESGTVVGYRGVDRNISIRKLMEESSATKSDINKKILNRGKGKNDIISICASCKMIRDDKGSWNNMENYFENRFDIEFSHGICPPCAKKLYPELYNDEIE
jgi:PAS domain S-box-containing protein